MATTSLRMTNRLLSKLKSIVSYRDHKRTQQEVLDVLLLYLYNRYIVCAIVKYTYSWYINIRVGLFINSINYILLLYTRSTCLKGISLWWCYLLNIYKISLSSVMAILLATHSYSNNAIIQISYFPWWEYSYLTQSSITVFFYLTSVSVLLLKPSLEIIY